LGLAAGCVVDGLRSGEIRFCAAPQKGTVAGWNREPIVAAEAGGIEHQEYVKGRGRRLGSPPTH